MESPNFIWPTVIEAAGIFRWWLAVAAAAKAFNAARPPFQLSPLSLFSRWTMTVSELTHKPSTWLKDCGHSPLCHPQATTKPTGHYQDMIPVTMGHQEWMENLLFLTCFDSEWPGGVSNVSQNPQTNQVKETRNKIFSISQTCMTVLQNNRTDIVHFYESKNNLQKVQRSYELAVASLNVLRTSF